MEEVFPHHGGMEDYYNPEYAHWWERTFSGLNNEKEMEAVYVELE